MENNRKAKETAIMIVDSREQKPLWEGKQVIRKKLDTGDYASEDTQHLLTIERKSPGDLYGSIIQGHDRFRREMVRSINANKEFYVFVECSREDFVGKKWKGAYRLKGSCGMLAAILKTLEDEYDVIFVWCGSRVIMRAEISCLLKVYKESFIY